MSERTESMHGTWANRWIFILAATGSAVGLGNIWKFPYITGENGGGAFVLVYLVCIGLIGIPIMIGEVLIGRRGKHSPIESMRILASEAEASRFWVALGWLGAIAGFLILSYYSVIAGWALMYVYRMGSGAFEQVSGEASEQMFNALLADPVTLLILHSIFMVMTMVVVARGVNHGIEKAIKILMPALFVLLILLLGYGLNSGGFDQGFNFLFNFDFSKLGGESILIAMGHAFFTLSLGMGAIMVYGAYMPCHASISTTVVTVAVLDTVVALAAGLAIFPIVFANSMEPSAGPGLMFITLPVAFGQMSYGIVFGTLFFVLVSFAAWSSSISLIEPLIAWFVEKDIMSRAKASLILGVVTWLLGIGTVLSFNEWSEVKFFGLTFFDSLDYLTANIMLPVGGLLIAVFAGWVMRRTTVQKELEINSYALYNLWTVVVRLVAPPAVAIVILWTLFQEQIKAILGL